MSGGLDDFFEEAKAASRNTALKPQRSGVSSSNGADLPAAGFTPSGVSSLNMQIVGIQHRERVSATGSSSKAIFTTSMKGKSS
jgi:hypothetical protein